MAAGFLRHWTPSWQIDSAGTFPAEEVHPLAIQVMKESGIDISRETPLNVAQFLKTSYDYVITVCDEANESCPIFSGSVKQRLHIGFEDPAKAVGSADFILSEFRRISQAIESRFYALFKSELV